MKLQIKQALGGLVTAAMATALLAVATTADAQYQEHWRVEGQTYLTGGLTRGLAYNPASDNVLIVTRNQGSRVLVLDAEDGSPKTEMNTSGVGAGSFFEVNKVQAVDRGSGDYSVYVGSLTLQAKLDGFGSGPFALYRWTGSGGADEGTLGAPTMIYRNKTADAITPIDPPDEAVGPPMPATKDNVRIGDSMHAVYDSGTNTTRLYFGVSTAQTTDLLYVFTVDEATGAVSAVDALTLAGHTGATSYGPTVDLTGNIYYITNGTPSSRYYAPNGAHLLDLDPTVFLNNSTQPRFMWADGRSFIGVIDPSSTPTYNRVRVIDVTAGAALATHYSTSQGPTSPVANANATGDVAMDTARNRFVGLVTDNMVISFSEERVLLVDLESFTAGVNEPSGTVTIKWETAREIDNVGFNVYRTSENSLSVANSARINSVMIPGQGDGQQPGASYSLVDSTPLAAGESRGYILEDIDANGNATRHGPVFVTRDGSDSSVGEWPQF